MLIAFWGELSNYQLCCRKQSVVKWRQGYLLPTLARKITCRHFDWMLQSSSGRKIKLVTDNLLFIYAEANWEATENLWLQHRKSLATSAQQYITLNFKWSSRNQPNVTRLGGVWEKDYILPTSWERRREERRSKYGTFLFHPLLPFFLLK